MERDWMSEDFLLIAHRGFSSKAPENTFAAFDLALSSGFSHFELDAQLTADGAPVVIHDATLERTTSGRGRVAWKTLAEIQKLDAGSWFGPRREYAGERVRTLAEVLERYAGRAHIHLELKSPEPELPGKVADLLSRHGWLDVAAGDPLEAPGITVSSFHVDQLRRGAALLPRVRRGWLVEEITPEVIRQAESIGAAAIYPRAARVSPQAVADALDKGYLVRGWGIRTADDLYRLADAGARGATVDWPDAAAGLLRAPR